MRNRVMGLALVLTVAVFGAACSGGDDGEAASSGQGLSAEVQAGGGSEGGGGNGGGGSIGSSRGLAGTTAYAMDADQPDSLGDADVYATQAELPLAQERVIKTADVRLDVADGTIGRALREGREIAEAAGGFLLSTSIDGRGQRSGEFTVRVPAERFEETLSALEDLGEIAGEEVRGEDVSQEFVDLEARLRNATAQEEVLFRLYDRSQSIADTIRVQRELEDVQLEIERLRGRLRYLEDRTDLSTITVLLFEEGADAAEPGPFAKAWDNAKDTFAAVVSGVIVGAGFALPLLLMALVAYAVFRALRPRFGRAAAPTPADS
jgi:hypothetical protein